MNNKLIAAAVFAALFSASAAVHAQSLVGGATGSLRGAAGIGPGGLGSQDPIGRIGARDTVNGAQRELRGSLAERRAELRELRNQQQAARAAAEAAAAADAAAAASAHGNDQQDDRMLADGDSMLGAIDGQAEGAGSVTGMVSGQADDAEASEEDPAVPESDAPRANAGGEADAGTDASASRRGASVGVSASARGDASVED